MVTVRIDPDTGLLATNNQGNAVFETFREEFVPTQSVDNTGPSGGTTPGESGITEQLF